MLDSQSKRPTTEAQQSATVIVTATGAARLGLPQGTVLEASDIRDGYAVDLIHGSEVLSGACCAPGDHSKTLMLVEAP